MTKKEAGLYINEVLAELGEPPLTENELKDWSLEDGIPEEKLREWAKDFASDMHSERCEEKNAWRYER